MRTLFAASSGASTQATVATERKADSTTRCESNLQFWFSAIGLAVGFIVLAAISLIG